MALDRLLRRADVGNRRRADVILLIGPTSGIGCLLPAFPQCNVSGSPNAQPMLGRCQDYMRPTSDRHRADVRPTFDHQKLLIYICLDQMDVAMVQAAKQAAKNIPFAPNTHKKKSY